MIKARGLVLCLVLGYMMAPISQLRAQQATEAKRPTSYQKNPPSSDPKYFRSSGPSLGPEMFFDAETTRFTKDGSQQVFEGNVVAIGGGVIVTADQITIHRQQRQMSATGHVIILTENQVFAGDRVVYHTESGDFLLVNSLMVANDPVTSARYSREVLGLTPSEIAFETRRAERLSKIENNKNQLKETYANQFNPGDQPSSDLVDQYSLLLEQEDLANHQINPFLAKFSKEKQHQLIQRRKQWKKSIAEAKSLYGQQSFTAFFQVRGKKLQRQDQHRYLGEDTFWSPCKCEEGDSPAWGLRSSAFEAQTEGYLDFYHPVLEIKGMPVFYLPFFKIPMKEKRQSGFLMPTYANRNRTGNIFSQPIYFAVDNDMDMTLTPEIYEKRGTKVGLEFRFQQKQYSGFELNLEGIRDQLWAEDRKLRQAAYDYYFGRDGEVIDSEICSEDDPNLETNCKIFARNYLAVPENTWRGAQTWRGLTILAPRLSLVTQGQLYSDHRYVEELTLYEDFQTALDPNSSRANQFSTTKYRLHLDGKNFYAGLGGSLGDRVKANDRFEGHQIPLYAVSQSRFYNIDRQVSPIPIYGDVMGEHYTLVDWQGKSTINPDPSDLNQTLGEGYWRRFKITQVSPLITHGIFQVSQFSDWELRSITHTRLSEEKSSIQSGRYGVTFKLPIDGDAPLPSLFQDEDANHAQRYVRHYMDWNLTLSVRPSVNREGPYGAFHSQYLEGNPAEVRQGGELVYFASDRRDDSVIDDDIGESQTMVKHRLVTFSTNHTWDIFDKGWERKKADVKRPVELENAKRSYGDRAKEELIYSLDQPVGGYESMFQEGTKKIYIDRYQKTEKNKKRVVEYSSSMSYNFEKVEKRRVAKEERQLDPIAAKKGQIDLPQPWSEFKNRLKINLLDSSLTNETHYNIYFRLITKQDFKLDLPTFFQTTFSLGYVIDNAPGFDKVNQTLTQERTATQIVSVSSNFVSNYVLAATIGRRTSVDILNVEANPKPEYLYNYGMEYISPSECWKLNLVREVKWGRDHREAEYFLELTILFLGRSRGTRNISQGLVRELPNRED